MRHNRANGQFGRRASVFLPQMPNLTNQPNQQESRINVPKLGIQEL
jgi:hypothetical protein